MTILSRQFFSLAMHAAQSSARRLEERMAQRKKPKVVEIEAMAIGAIQRIQYEMVMASLIFS